MLKNFFNSNKLLPLSLYIHIPWYIEKINNLNISKYKNKITEKKYIYHLLKDFEQDSLLFLNRKINTIFIGGPAPNLLSSTSIKYLLNNIKNIIHVSKKAEITIECNFEKLNIEQCFNYKNAGINRFSIKVKTFCNKKLNFTKENYNFEKILKTISHTNIKKLQNVNLDLIYGLPEQSLQKALLDLKIAINLMPNHISWYEYFVFKKNTNIISELSNKPSSNTIWNIYLQGNNLLKKSGYKKYEIISYSKKNYECLHNLNYWKFGDYIGIGCNAHGKRTLKNGKVIRTIKQKTFENFVKKNYIYSEKIVFKKDLPLEFFMNRFRLNEPIPRIDFKKYTNLSEKYIQNEIKKAIMENYLVQTKKHWKTTTKGKHFLDSLLEIFIK